MNACYSTILAGIPTAVLPAGTSDVTTALAPIFALSPIYTPPQYDGTGTYHNILT